MLKLTMVKGELTVSQTVTSPSIYLDLCALMDIALNNCLSSQFRKAILHKNGTLLFSYMHLLEFSDITDKTQLGIIGSFLDSLLEHFGFIDVIPENVIKKENQRILGNKNIYPSVDESLIMRFVSLKSKSLKPLISFSDLLNMLNHNELKLMKKNFHIRFDSVIAELRRRKREDRKFSLRISSAAQGMDANIATRYIEQELLNLFIKENNIITSNSWRDFYHTIVPLAYCDYVLFDKQFSHIAKQISMRLNKERNLKIARVYSKINTFINDFKA